MVPLLSQGSPIAQAAYVCRRTSAITESRELTVHCEFARLPRLRFIALFCPVVDSFNVENVVGIAIVIRPCVRFGDRSVCLLCFISCIDCTPAGINGRYPWRRFKFDVTNSELVPKLWHSFDRVKLLKVEKRIKAEIDVCINPSARFQPFRWRSLIVRKNSEIKHEHVLGREDCACSHSVIRASYTSARYRPRRRFSNCVRMKFESQPNNVADPKIRVVAVLYDPRAYTDVK